MEPFAACLQYLRPTSKWAIGAIAFAVCGILTNVGVLLVYAMHNDTPVVRASGRELSYVILIGEIKSSFFSAQNY